MSVKLFSPLLLMVPSSIFVGLISLHVGELSKFGLWSFKVMKHSAMVAVRSSTIVYLKFACYGFCFCVDDLLVCWVVAFR